MGIVPAAIDQMSLWEFNAMWGGWAHFNLPDPEGDKPSPPTPEEYYDMIAWRSA